MHLTRSCLFLFCLILPAAFFGQQKTAVVSGKVIDVEEKPLSGVSVIILGRHTGTVTNDSGIFTLAVPANKAIALTFSFTGWQTVQRNFFLNENEQEKVMVRMESNSKTLQEVIVKNDRSKADPGLLQLNPKYALAIPAATGGVENLIKVFVGSNNELTSQYTVRGGNYDENLVYINDFEIFRPYLISKGQQEGLSFINPELTGGLNFYNGGFQSKYGDKMSSVLEVRYKKPVNFAGSAYVGLLEQGFHVEGLSKNRKLSYLLGVRNRSNKNLLSAQETKGNYIPSSSDVQAIFTYRFNDKWQMEWLGVLSGTKFKLIPEEAKLTSSVLSPLFSSNLGLDIYFEGQEHDRYQTHMLGMSVVRQVNQDLKLKWLLSRFENDESEAYDIAGAYLFGERSFDKSQPDFGSITNPLGAGVFMNHARNTLNIQNWNLSHKGNWRFRKQFFQWGVSLERTGIRDRLSEWELQDSAGFNLPYPSSQLELQTVRKSQIELGINKFSGYIQNNVALGRESRVSLQGGVRFNYNSLTQEWLVSPRVQMSWMPGEEKDWVFNIAAGVYDQPPFYREFRRYDGSVNLDVKAQKSWQVVAGAARNFVLWERPSRMTIETYYKRMTQVDPYDIDNVRIRYFGNNSARAFATGIEMRLFSELVKDAESWISVGLMRTMEKIDDFYYYRYKNAAGEYITAQTEDQLVSDSVRFDKGWMKRPTDRLLTFGMFFQDYLSTNKNFKVHLNMIYGSSMPYNIPGSVRYRNGLVLDPYFRVDIGFSALLLDGDKATRRSHSPFRKLESIWASLEVFNLLDRDNTISYLLIRDFSNTVYTLPNRLTPRLLNFKILVRF